MRRLICYFKGHIPPPQPQQFEAGGEQWVLMPRTADYTLHEIAKGLNFIEFTIDCCLRCGEHL